MAAFFLLGNSGPSQMFGCVIQTENYTVIIDGGTTEDEKQLVEFLDKNADSHVDAWFFTHPHHDHIGCFVNICKNAPQITVDNLPSGFLRHYPAYKSGHLNISELARVCDLSRTTIYKYIDLLEG